MRGRSAATERRWQNVQVVREKDRHSLRWLGRLLLGVVAAASPLVVYLVQQMDYVQVRYRMEELRARQERLGETERRLRIERATLRTLPLVEAQAASDDDLVHLPPERLIVVRRATPARGPETTRAPDGTRGSR